MQATPRDEAVRLAMEMSLAEEETRKQRERELEEAEDEAMRLALEASLLLAKEESLKEESCKGWGGACGGGKRGGRRGGGGGEGGAPAGIPAQPVAE